MTHRECAQCGQALRVPTDAETICGECEVANRCDKVNDRLRALLERAAEALEAAQCSYLFAEERRLPTICGRTEADIRKELGK